jgi:hypothetical protein
MVWTGFAGSIAGGFKRCLRVCLAATVVCLVTGGLAASSAQAVDWSCGVISPGTWCLEGPGTGQGHTWDFSRATYPGAGDIYECTKIISSADTSIVIARSCGLGPQGVYSSQKGYTGTYNTNVWAYVLVANGSQTCCPHTINGYAYY